MQEIRVVQLELEELAMQAELEGLCSAVECMIQHDPMQELSAVATDLQQEQAPPQQEQVAPARTIRISAYDPHRYEGDRPQGAQHNHGGKA